MIPAFPPAFPRAIRARCSPLVTAMAVAALAFLAAAPPAGARDNVKQPMRSVDGRTTGLSSVFVIRDAAAPDAVARDVDYGELLTVQSVEALPGARLTETFRAPIGTSLVPAGAALVPVQNNGVRTWCHTVRSAGIWIPNGMRYCFADAEGDGRFEQSFIGSSTPGFSNIAYSGVLSPMRHGAFRYEPMTEPGAPGEIVALRYLGPTRGLVRDGQVIGGTVSFEIVMGPDRVHFSQVAKLQVRLDRDGRGVGRGPLAYEVRVEKATADGRARVQVIATPPAGQATL